MSSSLGSSHGSSGSGSLTASGEVNVSKRLEDLDHRELEKISIYIMQEFTPIFSHVHYCRLCPWKYKRDGLEFTYNSFRGGLKDTHGRLLKHDSVVVQYGADEWIKGEKGGVDAKMKVGGIRVYPVTDSRDPEDWEDKGDNGPGRYSVRFSTGEIKLGKGEKEWTMRKLKELLSLSDDPHYHVLSANCWKYAYLGAEAVLEWVKSNALDAEVKNQVQEKLNQLKRVKRPQPLEVWRALRKASPDELRVLSQYRRKLSDTCRHLPPKSHVRKHACRRIKKIVSSRCNTKVCDAGSESDRISLVRRVLRRRLRFSWQSSALVELRHSKQEQLVEVSAPSDEEWASDEGGASEAEPQDCALARTKMGHCRKFKTRPLDRRIKMGLSLRIERIGALFPRQSQYSRLLNMFHIR